MFYTKMKNVNAHRYLGIIFHVGGRPIYARQDLLDKNGARGKANICVRRRVYSRRHKESQAWRN